MELILSIILKKKVNQQPPAVSKTLDYFHQVNPQLKGGNKFGLIINLFSLAFED